MSKLFEHPVVYNDIKNSNTNPLSLISNIISFKRLFKSQILLRPFIFSSFNITLANFYKISSEEILVVHDELDLNPGIARLKSGGGHGGHNGIRDMVNHLSSRDFLRLRIGIGHPGHKDAVTRYVLSRSPKAQREEIDGALDRAERVLPLVLEGRLQEAMTRLHTQP